MNNNLLATIIAFYLSKFNDLALKKLGYKTYKDAFMECGRLIDVKPNYIKLRRDEFDPVYNWRKGWRNRPMYNPQIQISAESETKRSIFREKDKTKRSKKESAQHSKSRNKSFVMTSVSAL